MLAEIVISPGGEVTVVTREGSFEEGAEKISALLAALEALGVKSESVKFERHRHDKEKVSLAQGVKAGA